jgi:hypothetical protein
LADTVTVYSVTDLHFLFFGSREPCAVIAGPHSVTNGNEFCNIVAINYVEYFAFVAGFKQN